MESINVGLSDGRARIVRVLSHKFYFHGHNRGVLTGL